MALLDVQNLTMHYTTRKGDVWAVDDVHFTLERGDSLGLVGESGCGKTSIAICLLRILPDNGKILNGHIYFKDRDLASLPEDKMRKVRWKEISMIFQAAMNALNPVYKVGDQIIEAIRAHENISEEAARERVVELFNLVGLNPDRMDHYPHEYSGGMKQRAIIAMALSCNPDIIIADEPTTALDVIVQDRILDEMDGIREKLNMSMIYISHDIAVIAEVSDRIGVMYAGKMVEFADKVTIFKRPVHPYTYALMNAFPSIKGEKRELQTLAGEPPDLLHPPAGCRFHPRCAYATAICEKEDPPFENIGDSHYRACWNPLE